MHDPNSFESSVTPGSSDGLPSDDDRNLALIAHLSGCAGLIAGGLIGFLGPLVVYLLKKDSSTFVGAQAKEALNFQITLLLISALCIVLALGSCGVLFPVVFLPMVLQLVFGVIAAIAVRDGSPYQYPFNLRLLK